MGSYVDNFIALPVGRTFEDERITKVPPVEQNLTPSLESPIYNPEIVDEEIDIPILISGDIIIQTRPSTYNQFVALFDDDRGENPDYEPNILPEFEHFDDYNLLDHEWGPVETYLLSYRQGDELYWLPERNDGYPEQNDPIIFYQWTNREPGYSYKLLPPRIKPFSIPNLDEEYYKLQEYDEEQRQELEDYDEDQSTLINIKVPIVKRPVTPKYLKSVLSKITPPNTPRTIIPPSSTIYIPPLIMTNA